MNIITNQIFIGLVEIPDEISLIIPVAGCGHSCIGCHSPEFKNKNNGIFFSMEDFKNLILKFNKKVSCICFFNGYIQDIFYYVEEAKLEGFKTAFYTGNDYLDPILYKYFDYIKYGHYDSNLGGLREKTTNQILLKKEKDDSWINITNKFWRTYD